jgi:hypothetical protein
VSSAYQDDGPRTPGLFLHDLKHAQAEDVRATRARLKAGRAYPRTFQRERLELVQRLTELDAYEAMAAGAEPALLDCEGRLPVRCSDCGRDGETTGHQTCPSPQDRP